MDFFEAHLKWTVLVENAELVDAEPIEDDAKDEDEDEAEAEDEGEDEAEEEEDAEDAEEDVKSTATQINGL